ncbi:hypothetical protein BC936DRAFT_148564 [Jimgerdemannia flammicorona]|uniref:Uncharacterized protein n=1 Tax=Jimgerdemannia flammicorona TaxID=994334 RepID=A0A433D2S7_9FUNG|nr:hypothetical protein BC936DRAFT_148564 [Jimgerdemannia flammicorona]
MVTTTETEEVIKSMEEYLPPGQFIKNGEGELHKKSAPQLEPQGVSLPTLDLPPGFPSESTSSITKSNNYLVIRTTDLTSAKAESTSVGLIIKDEGDA